MCGTTRLLSNIELICSSGTSTKLPQDSWQNLIAYTCGIFVSLWERNVGSSDEARGSEVTVAKLKRVSLRKETYFDFIAPYLLYPSEVHANLHFHQSQSPLLVLPDTSSLFCKFALILINRCFRISAESSSVCCDKKKRENTIFSRFVHEEQGLAATTLPSGQE